MKIIRGNIFTSKCQTLVNTVNCVGFMGAGIALEHKFRYPVMNDKYVDLCKNGLFSIGQLYLYKSEDKWILNFPTKQHYKYPSKREYLEKGLTKFIETYKQKGIKSIAFPLLGAQNGGLDKDDSLDIMKKYLANLDIPVEIYIYEASANDDLIYSFKKSITNKEVGQIKSDIGITKKQSKTLKDELNRISNLNGLHHIKGFGEKAIQKCYEYAMSNKTEIIQTKLF